MHLHAANRFFNDDSASDAVRNFLTMPDHLGAFLLGSVAPDARVSGGLKRVDTHFFDYAPTIHPHACDNMLETYPKLWQAEGAHRAFVAGYLGHLAMDVIWAQDMLYPYFYAKDWATGEIRYIMLHAMLSELDERDYRQWDANFHAHLATAKPDGWLAFMSDENLITWRDLIANQICEGCESLTLSVLGGRVAVGESGLRQIVSDPTRMDEELWEHVPRSALAEIEQAMYQSMSEWLAQYTLGSGDK